MPKRRHVTPDKNENLPEPPRHAIASLDCVRIPRSNGVEADLKLLTEMIGLRIELTCRCELAFAKRVTADVPASKPNTPIPTIAGEAC